LSFEEIINLLRHSLAISVNTYSLPRSVDELERARPLLLDPKAERVATPKLHVRHVLLQVNGRLGEQNIAHFARERHLAEAVRAGVDVEGDW
jgi:hypothetical protein